MIFYRIKKTAPKPSSGGGRSPSAKQTHLSKAHDLVFIYMVLRLLDLEISWSTVEMYKVKSVTKIIKKVYKIHTFIVG